MRLFASSARSLLNASTGYSTGASRLALAAPQRLCPNSRLANKGFGRRALSATSKVSTHKDASKKTSLVAAMGMIAAIIDYNNRTNHGVLSVGSLSCDRVTSCDRVYSSGDVLSVGKITNEPATKIQFPALCNAMSLAGVGVRVKYIFVNAYAVGAYFDPIAMMAVKKGSKADIEKALCDPTYPRTFRIVMNRGLSGKLSFVDTRNNVLYYIAYWVDTDTEFFFSPRSITHLCRTICLCF